MVYHIVCFVVLHCIVLCAVVLCCSSVGEESAKDVKIVAVDLQAMAPIPGVVQIQGDITKVSVVCWVPVLTYIYRHHTTL